METFRTYDPGDYYDELIDANGNPRPGSQLLVDKIESLPQGDLAMRQRAAEALFPFHASPRFHWFQNKATVQRWLARAYPKDLAQ